MKVIALLIIMFVSTYTFANEKVRIALEQFAWEKRQLIVFTPDENHKEYKKYKQLVNLKKIEIDDRKLHTWHVINNDKVKLNNKFINSFSNQDIRETFKIKPNDFRIILIGYDQGEKLRLEHFDLEYIFSKIDQMPMRIQEMQDNN